VFLVPLWWARERSASIARAGLCGFVFGAVAYMGGHPWLLALVDVFLAGDFGVGLVLWTLYGIGFATGFAFYALLFAWLRGRGVGFVTSALPLWIVIEWLQPLLFPVHCGAALVNVLPLAQAADLGGPLLLSTQVVLANIAVLETARWSRGHTRRPIAIWLSTTLVLVASLGYGPIKARTLASRGEVSTLRVGIVQANLGLLEKRTRTVVGHRKHLEQTRELLAQGEVDLVVWPETAYAQAIRGPLPVSGRLVQQELRVPLLFGAPIIDRPGADPLQSNAAMLVGHEGLIRNVYRKNLLIPLAESVPFASFWPSLAERLPHAQRFAAATGKPALELDDFRIAVPICYEAVQPSFVREMVNEGRANLIVTLANDAWFGDTREPILHLQLARLRAVEHRLYLVRATNSGISAIIDPMGRIVEHTGQLERANLRGSVDRMPGGTLYAALGDWPGVMAGLWLLVGASRSRTGGGERN
ncbi:MAG: apolipoprotein N-acyltransferase, partial [bacterium]|nr:apolipoprotein N-acyltransferase [bacterium]